MTHDQVAEALRQLEDGLPRMIEADATGGDFLSTFAGEADCIADGAPEHAEFIQGRLNCMLGAAGLVPSDNEGEDCVQQGGSCTGSTNATRSPQRRPFVLRR